MTVLELKEICRVYGLPVSRRKQDLIDRLVPFIEGLAIDTIDRTMELSLAIYHQPVYYF